LALLTLAACARDGQDQMSWARAALERNKDIEIVTADQESRTFTVRMKGASELQKVRADQLVGSFEGATPAAATASASGPAASATPVASSQPADASATAGEMAEPAAPAQESIAASSAASAPPADLPGGRVLSTGPGYTIKAAAGAGAATRLASGGLSESGPGYSIKSVSGTPAGAVRARETGMTSAVLERRHEPIVCQGSRLLHIDNRNLQFDGDAVSAEDGCEIHITNSHITATGVGVQARAANVHIDNSSIEGTAASIDASDGAQVYATGSHFTGMNRQLDSASFHDLGGNIWN
jgi:hypothetical protein